MFIYNVETNNDFQASPKFTKIVLLGLNTVNVCFLTSQV